MYKVNSDKQIGMIRLYLIKTFILKIVICLAIILLTCNAALGETDKVINGDSTVIRI
jgi:hypothetical protein